MASQVKIYNGRPTAGPLSSCNKTDFYRYEENPAFVPLHPGALFAAAQVSFGEAMRK